MFGRTRTCPMHTNDCPNCGGKGYQVWCGRTWVSPIRAQAHLRTAMNRTPHRNEQPRLSARDLRCLMSEPNHPGCKIYFEQD